MTRCRSTSKSNRMHKLVLWESSCYSSNDWKTLKTYLNTIICLLYKCWEKCLSMGQNKKYTNKMLFYSTIASIFGHITDTMIHFISINQSCHIKHNAAVQLQGRGRFAEKVSLMQVHDSLTMIRKDKYLITKISVSKKCVDHDKLVFICYNKANIHNLLLYNTITCISRRN